VNERDYGDAVVNFYEGLYAFGYSLTGNEDDASELTEETFYRLPTKGAMERDASKIKSWLFTTLYRIFLGWEQRRVSLPHFEISSVENELARVRRWRSHRDRQRLGVAVRTGQDGGPNGLHNQLFFTGGPNGHANGIFGIMTFGQ
jgi:DNA-directed RNA polymerase specialized sigma24 family protein